MLTVLIDRQDGVNCLFIDTNHVLDIAISEFYMKQMH